MIIVNQCQGHGSAWHRTQARLAWRGSCQAAALVGCLCALAVMAATNPGQCP